MHNTECLDKNRVYLGSLCTVPTNALSPLHLSFPTPQRVPPPQQNTRHVRANVCPSSLLHLKKPSLYIHLGVGSLYTLVQCCQADFNPVSSFSALCVRALDTDRLSVRTGQDAGWCSAAVWNACHETVSVTFAYSVTTMPGTKTSHIRGPIKAEREK